MNPKLEAWVDTIAFSLIPAGVAAFGVLGSNGTIKTAGIAAGAAFFGTLAAHFKMAPNDTTTPPTSTTTKTQ